MRYQSVFVLAAILSARTFVAAICFPGFEVKVDECKKALTKIVYSKPNDTLDRVSTRFSRVYGNCTLTVKNPNKILVTKKQIEDGFYSIMDLCETNPGDTTLPHDVDFRMEIHDHRLGRDVPYFPPRKITCGQNSNASLTQNGDCDQAYRYIFANAEGRMVDDKLNITKSITKSYKTCTVLVYTTDGSPLTTKKRETYSTVSEMIKECHGKSAVLGLENGASGNNGRAVIKIRSSERCRDVEHPDGQVCK